MRWLVLLFLLFRLTAGAQEVTPALKPYTVSRNLAEVANLKQFSLPPPATELLAKNLFVVVPASYWQPFFVYEENVYREVPSFITTDSVLHLYHLFFNFALRQLEEEKLYPLAKEFTSALHRQCLGTYRTAPTPELKEAARRNLAYVTVAADLLGVGVQKEAAVSGMVAEELDLVRKHEGWQESSIFPYRVDYSQFVPRGHYTRSEELKRYFLGMMWYGLVPFAPRWKDPLTPAPGVLRQTLLLVRDISEANLTQKWDALYTPINFFVGFSDDLRPDEVRALSEAVFGKKPSLSAFADGAKFQRFADDFVKLRMPSVTPKIYNESGFLTPFPDPAAPQLRLFGQRYVPDSEILQELVGMDREKFLKESGRMLPKGLDVMAVLGSRRAVCLLDELYREPEKWSGYLPARKKLTEKFASVDEAGWTRNLYWHWLYVLKSFLAPYGEGYPSFMTTTAWQDKNLQTALASWTQLRHDTILYAKQSFIAAECGDGDAPRPTKGYVEPNVEAYRRLLALAKQTRSILQPRGLLSAQMADKLAEFEDMVAFLLDVSEKELQGKRLTTREYERIRHLGAVMDKLALWVVTKGNLPATEQAWREIVHPTDRNMACVADVHTCVDKREPPVGIGDVVLEEAVGHAYEIYVIVPVEGKLQLTRGAVFSYFEFPHPMKDRLTDENWQKMLGEGKAPPQPEWIQWFTLPGREKVVPNTSSFTQAC